MIRFDGWPGFYATIEPAASRWLPWPGRASRWWFEVMQEDADGVPIHWWQLDGGAFTLRGAVFKAEDAMVKAWDQWKRENPR